MSSAPSTLRNAERGRAARFLRRCGAAFAMLPASVLAAALDPGTGLVKQPGWEDVRSHCGACHSYRLITNQRGSREDWQHMIRWMQRTANLWQLPHDAEVRILDYLSTHYASRYRDENRKPPQRRKPLPPELMPASGGG